MLTKQAVEYLKLGTGGSYSLARDAIKHQIWDTRYFATTIADWTFYQQPLNAPWRVGVKTLNETNLNDSGKLPNGQTMLFTRFGVAVIVPLAIADTTTAVVARSFANLLQSSVFEIRIAGRDFDFQIHGSQFLPRPIFLTGIQDNATNANDTYRVGDMIASGWAKLDPAPIFVDQLVSFSVVHRLGNPDTSVKAILDADASALYGEYATMQVTLEGFLTRAK